MPLEFDAQQIYARFLSVQMQYASRNAQLDDIQMSFEGGMWTEEEPGGEEEHLQLVLNYVQKSVMWHVGLLTGKPPRVDVPVHAAEPDPSATRREQFLRSLVATSSFMTAWRRIEVYANKYGYGVMQVLWAPEDGQPVKRELARAEDSKSESSRPVYSKSPFVFRAIDPRAFYPKYQTLDRPDDFLYVFRLDEHRLVEDLQEKYDADLGATGYEAGTFGTCDLVEYWDKEWYVLLAVTTKVTVDNQGHETEEKCPVELVRKEHDYGRIPFFVLPNVLMTPEKDPTDGGSISEALLVDAINKHLNFIVTEVAEEIAGRVHPPVVYQSDDPQQDASEIRVGAGEVIPIGLDEKLEPLAWQGVPGTVAEHRNAIMGALRDISGLPKTSLGQTEGASGVGMKLAYAVLEMVLPLKIPERKDMLERALGHVLGVCESRMPRNSSIALVLPSEGTMPTLSTLSYPDIDGNYVCKVTYGNLIPRDQVQHEQHVVYLVKSGVISHRTGLEMLDTPYVTDPEAELDRIRAERKDKALHPEYAEILGEKPQQQQQLPSQRPGASPAEGGLTMNAAPPVPTSPEMPTQQNAPFLQRGAGPNFGQLFPGGPGANQGPPMENQG